jgi:hypothetical protein
MAAAGARSRSWNSDCGIFGLRIAEFFPRMGAKKCGTRRRGETRREIKMASVECGMSSFPELGISGIKMRAACTI